jgi:hypothetical protein
MWSHFQLTNTIPKQIKFSLEYYNKISPMLFYSLK